MAQFAQDDDSGVVIIGSGAGGGTPGNELAQKGARSSSPRPAAGTRSSTSSMTNGELHATRLDRNAHHRAGTRAASEGAAGFVC